MKNEDQIVAAVEEAPGLERVDMEGRDGELVMNLVNLFAQVTRPIRNLAGPTKCDSEIMTAAILMAGTIFGELEYIGAQTDCGDEEIALMLTANFNAGREAGKARLARVRVEWEAEQATRQ